LFFLLFISFLPFFLGDPEIFISIDKLVSPLHIVPEWYFLYIYAILRAIPNKVLGVWFLINSQLVFLFLSLSISFYSPLVIFLKTFV